MVKKPESTNKTPQANELAWRAAIATAMARCQRQMQFDAMMKSLEARKCSS